MTIYHTSPRTGKAARCRAYDACPYGGTYGTSILKDGTTAFGTASPTWRDMKERPQRGEERIVVDPNGEVKNVWNVENRKLRSASLVEEPVQKPSPTLKKEKGVQLPPEAFPDEFGKDENDVNSIDFGTDVHDGNSIHRASTNTAAETVEKETESETHPGGMREDYGMTPHEHIRPEREPVPYNPNIPWTHQGGNTYVEKEPEPVIETLKAENATGDNISFNIEKVDGRDRITVDINEWRSGDNYTDWGTYVKDSDYGKVVVSDMNHETIRPTARKTADEINARIEKDRKNFVSDEDVIFNVDAVSENNLDDPYVEWEGEYNIVSSEDVIIMWEAEQED